MADVPQMRIRRDWVKALDENMKARISLRETVGDDDIFEKLIKIVDGTSEQAEEEQTDEYNLEKGEVGN